MDVSRAHRSTIDFTVNHSHYLPTLYRSSRRRLARLRELAIYTSTGDHRDDREARMAYCTTELANRWAVFCRNYYLSAVLGAKTSRGTIVRCSVGRLPLNDAVGQAVLWRRPKATAKDDGSWHRRYEPTWHDPSVLISLMTHVGSSNVDDVRQAFSTGTRTFIDLPVFRNFFAHRNHSSMCAAQALGPRYGIPATIPPAEILRRRALRRPQALLLDWIDDVRFTMEYLCT